jgi:hypothetical protein
MLRIQRRDDPLYDSDWLQGREAELEKPTVGELDG